MTCLSVSFCQSPEYKSPLKPRDSYTKQCSTSANSHSFLLSWNFPQFCISKTSSLIITSTSTPFPEVHGVLWPSQERVLFILYPGKLKTLPKFSPTIQIKHKFSHILGPFREGCAFSRPLCPNLIFLFPNCWSSGQNHHIEIGIDPYYFR